MGANVPPVTPTAPDEDHWAWLTSATVADGAGGVASPDSVQALFQEIVENAMDATGARFVLLVRFERPTRMLHVAAWAGLSSGPAGYVLEAARRLFPTFDPTRLVFSAEVNAVNRAVYLDGQSVSASLAEASHGVVDDRIIQLAMTVGHIRHVFVCPMLVHGEVVGALTFQSARPLDRSRRRTAEAFARQVALTLENARLYRVAQESVRLRDEWLSIAAHELRSPMTGVHGYAQLLRRHLSGGVAVDSRKVRQISEKIEAQSHKMGLLINQLLDIKRLESGKLTLEWQAVDLCQLVQDVAAATRLHSEGRPILVCAPRELVTMADPLRIEQVLTNLLSNAVRYGRAGTPIEVGVSRPAPDEVCLSVRDYGPGIAEEHRGRVFERFYQVPSSGAKPGMGLGLYVSRQIAELHGGRLELEAPAGGGARFLLVLPLRPPASAPPGTGD